MRDKNRIPRILSELENVWLKNPDLRLGQLITIAVRARNACPEIFYLEDDKILKGILSIGNEEIQSRNQKIKPYWEKYPNIIKIELKKLTKNLIREFIEVIHRENPDQVINPRSIMKLIGAPINDRNWMKKQEKRVEKIEILLKELKNDELLEIAEIGYRIKK